MATSDPLREYLYVSKRLTRDIVEGTTATTQRRVMSFSASLRGIGISLGIREPVWQNDIEMAQRATKVLCNHDQIGTLDPNASADYVQATLPLKCSVIDVHNPGFQVGLLTTDTITPLGRTLISLVGSPSNFRNRRSDNWRVPEECPSDIDGLMEVVRTVIENDDRQDFDYWNWDDHDPPIEAVVGIAVTLEKGRSERPPLPRNVEFLAKVHFHLGRSKSRDNKGDFDVVLIGAALWAATPPTKPLRPARTGIP